MATNNRSEFIVNPKYKKLKKLKKVKKKKKQIKQEKQLQENSSNNVNANNIEQMKREYKHSKLEQVPNTFVLYRIIGNDLYPRHKLGQARSNLQFVLEHEPELEHCEKRWIVNRIIDQQEEQKIIKLLNDYNQPFLHIPFIEKEYKKIRLDLECLPTPNYLYSEEFEKLSDEHKDRVLTAIYRLKNNYVMNNNGARNVALRDGKLRGKWVLPWDGNCFLTSNAWKQIYHDITNSPWYQYFTVPMTRIIDNSELHSSDFSPSPIEEPQLVFRKDSTEEFNEDFWYGRRPKVELFWRLGIPGKWDMWKDESWDQKRRPNLNLGVGHAGWVARMYSGMKELEEGNKKSFLQRGQARLEAIMTTLRYVDKIGSPKSDDLGSLGVIRSDILMKEKNDYLSGQQISPVSQLISDAKEAMTRGPYSVVDKKTLPPSRNPHDYWHPAPYWWPNPHTKDGLPYIQRDGQRIPGTRLYEPESDKYDRTRLQRVFDDSISLALGWYFTGKKEFAEHGATILETFFLNPTTQMTPHLRYAQVRMGRNRNKGASTGIIEMKDLYYYLDAVRLLTSAAVITEENMQTFKKWLSTYLEWLLQSPQGKKERCSKNNHGTYYDLQVVAIADFLGEEGIVTQTLLRAQSRISQQFSEDGSQPEELKRTTTAHYCCFNFQGWINITEIASKWGIDFWSYETNNGASLLKGGKWILSHVGKKWPYKQITEFDSDRFMPIWFAVRNKLINYKQTLRFPESKYSVKTRFFPHDGIRPYWNIGI
jgi:hypothetical protein